MPQAVERLRKMRAERCPLDLAMCGPPLTLTGTLSGVEVSLGWGKLGRAHTQV